MSVKGGQPVQPSAGNLPHALEPIIARDAELAELEHLLSTAAVLTLTGTGGVGKTTLARQLAERSAGRFSDGRWWVDLAPLGDGRSVASAVASVVGVPATADVGPLEQVASWLEGRSSLIVLDNCEHLVDACAEVAEAIAASSPATRVLATSREPLGVAGESTWRTPSLAVPPADTTLTAAELLRWDASALFLRRAEQSRPRRPISDDECTAVADICRRLDGVPLAITLAAVQVRVMALSAIRDGLEDRFEVLTRGDRTAPPRHRTLAASVAWSHDLLGEAERLVLRRLGVFPGEFTADDAGHVCAQGDRTPAGVRAALHSLVDRSLVEHVGDDRYRLLHTIRHFALDRAEEEGELERCRDRHVDLCVQICARRERGPLRMVPADRMGAERLADLRVALDRALAVGDPRAPELVQAVAELNDATGRHSENRELAARALAAASSTPERRAAVLAALGITAADAGDIATWQRQRAALDEVEDPHRRARLLVAVYGASGSGGDADASDALDEALESFRALGAVGDEVSVLAAKVRAFGAAGRQRGARTAWEELSDVLAAHDVRGLVTAAYHGVACMDEALVDAAELFRCHTEQLPHLPSPLVLQLFCAYWAQDPSLADDAFVSGGSGNLRGLYGTFGIMARALPAIVDGDHDAAAHELAHAHTDSGPPNVAMWVRMCDADVALRRGDRARAEAGAEKVRPMVRGRIEPKLSADLVSIELALALLDGDRGRAHELAHQLLADAVLHDHQLLVVDALEAVAVTGSLLDRPVDADLLLGAAESHRRRSGYRFRRAALEAPVAELAAAAAGSDSFSAGLGLGLAEAARIAGRGRGERRRPSRGWGSLTPAELDVVAAVVDGGTNREIADRLFLSVATVKTHLVHVYAKLGVRGRAELAAEATRQGVG